jgi:Asp-tRNA(Asn)/Glu-tRNA(Gln) amidotransferase A subunit family amidase
VWYTISSAELAQSLAHVRDLWDSFEPSLRVQLEAGERVTAAEYISATRQRHEIAGRFDDLLGDDAVLLTPTCNVQSWPAEGPLPRELHGVENRAIALNTVELNVTGHPGVSVPLGLDSYGVPFGLQIVAPRFGDALGLGLAAHLERERPWALAAPGYQPFWEPS